MSTEDPHLVIPAKAGIQYLQARIWIPALRSAAAGMTNLLAGLTTTPKQIVTNEICLYLVSERKAFQHRCWVSLSGIPIGIKAPMS